MQPQNAFTVKFDRPMRVLYTQVKICLPVALEEAKDNQVDLREYIAIWDTGATNSAISKKVVADLQLKPTGIVEVGHAQGKSYTNTYLVNIGLPNKVMYGQIRVTEVNLISDNNIHANQQPQVLIGMDIIGSGDFAVTNVVGKTVLSFRFPSAKEIDFIPEADRNNLGDSRKERRARERELRKKGLI